MSKRHDKTADNPLKLNRETLRLLTDDQLRQVSGGGVRRTVQCN